MIIPTYFWGIMSIEVVLASKCVLTSLIQASHPPIPILIKFGSLVVPTTIVLSQTMVSHETYAVERESRMRTSNWVFYLQTRM